MYSNLADLDRRIQALESRLTAGAAGAGPMNLTVDSSGRVVSYPKDITSSPNGSFVGSSTGPSGTQLPLGLPIDTTLVSETSTLHITLSITGYNLAVGFGGFGMWLDLTYGTTMYAKATAYWNGVYHMTLPTLMVTIPARYVPKITNWQIRANAENVNSVIDSNDYYGLSVIEYK